MKKIQLTLTLVLAALTLLQAQSARMKWGESIDTKRNVSEIMGEYDGDVISISEKKNGCLYYRCDSKDLSLKVQTEVQVPKVDGKTLQVEGYQMVKSELIIFASREVKDIHSLYAFTVNREGIVNQTPKKLFSVDLGNGKRGEFIFKTSLDKTRLLVMQRYFLRKEKKQVMEMKVFDEKLELVNEAKKSMPTKEDDEIVSIKSFSTDNNGDIYLLFNRANKKGQILSFDAFHFTIEKEVFEYDLDLNKLIAKRSEDIAISTAIFDVNSEGDLCIGGFYYGKVKKNWYNVALKGTFFIRIDGASHKVVSATAAPFDEEAKAELLRDKDMAKNREIPALYLPTKIIFKEDGGVVMLSEYYKVVVTRNATIVNYGPILVTSVDKDGEIEWVKAIFKNQVYGYNSMSFLVVDKAEFFSFVSGVRDGNIYIVINDNAKNLTAKNLKERTYRVDGMTRTVPVVLVMDKKGNLSKREILDGAKDGEVIIRPGVSNQVTATEVLLYGTKGSDDKLGRLYLE